MGRFLLAFALSDFGQNILDIGVGIKGGATRAENPPSQQSLKLPVFQSKIPWGPGTNNLGG